VLIDTNVAIHLRDGAEAAVVRLAAMEAFPLLSIVSRVELEGGVYRDPARAPLLRPRLDLLLESLAVLPFGDPEAAAYGSIVERSGFSRVRILDRMIAATALVHDATLITFNGADFRDIAGLRLEEWPLGTGG
jgi:predicted nucleic acid-binding protein